MSLWAMLSPLQARWRVFTFVSSRRLNRENFSMDASLDATQGGKKEVREGERGWGERK